MAAAASRPTTPPVTAAPAPAEPLPRPRRATTPVTIHDPLRGRFERAPGVEDLHDFFGDRPLSALSDARQLVALVRHLTATRTTGRLRLAGPRTTTFWIVDGQFGLSQSHPPRPEELLGHLVVKMGRVVSSQSIDEAVAMAHRCGRRIGEMLVEKGLVRPWQLDSALRRQCEARLLEAADWPFADYDFAPGERSPYGTTPLCSRMHMRVALARHVVAHATPVEIQERFGPLRKQYARLRGIVDLEEAALFGEGDSGPVLRRSFPGTHRLRDALSSCPLGRIPTMRLLVLLDVYGALQTSTEPLVLAAGIDAVGALRRRATDAQKEDHFRRLGAHHAMHADQIHDAYTRVKGDYAPGGRWQRLAPDAAATMARLIEESYRVLADPRTRPHCRRQLLGEDRARYVAELLYARARALAANGQEAAARPLAEVALELADLPEAQALMESAGG